MESIGLLTPPAHRMFISRSTFWRRPELKKFEPFAIGAFMLGVTPPRGPAEARRCRSARDRASQTHCRYRSRPHSHRHRSRPPAPRPPRGFPRLACSSVRCKGCPSPDNNEASWLCLPEIPVEERVVDGFAVCQCYNPQVSRARLARLLNLAPEANAAVVLHFAAERRGHHAFAPLALNVRPLAHHLLLEIPRRPHACAAKRDCWTSMELRNASNTSSRESKRISADSPP